MKYINVLLLTLLLVSCNNDDNDGVGCTEIFVSGLNVTVRNAVTNEALRDGIVVTAVDGDYVEVLSTVDLSFIFFGAGERSGNYILTVTGTGFETFTSETISVGADACHVITEVVEVSLQPN